MLVPSFAESVAAVGALAPQWGRPIEHSAGTGPPPQYLIAALPNVLSFWTPEIEELVPMGKHQAGEALEICAGSQLGLEQRSRTRYTIPFESMSTGFPAFFLAQ